MNKEFMANPEEAIKELFAYLKMGFNEDYMSAALALGSDGQLKLLIGLVSESGEFTPMLEVLSQEKLSTFQPWISPTAH